LFEDVIVNLVVSGERPSMRARGFGTRGGAACLENDDGLFLRNAGGDLGKGAAVLQVLEVLRDDLSVVVLFEKVRRSSSSMSDLLPRPTIAETPIFAERLKPMMAMPMPPDCEERAAWPFTS
jgi:hypothetical protein